MYLPRLIAHNHADAVAALKARRGALLDAANNALDLAAVVNHAGDPVAAGELIAEAGILFAQAEQLAPELAASTP